MEFLGESGNPCPVPDQYFAFAFFLPGQRWVRIHTKGGNISHFEVLRLGCKQGQYRLKNGIRNTKAYGSLTLQLATNAAKNY